MARSRADEGATWRKISSVTLFQSRLLVGFNILSRQIGPLPKKGHWRKAVVSGDRCTLANLPRKRHLGLGNQPGNRLCNDRRTPPEKHGLESTAREHYGKDRHGWQPCRSWSSQISRCEDRLYPARLPCATQAIIICGTATGWQVAIGYSSFIGSVTSRPSGPSRIASIPCGAGRLGMISPPAEYLDSPLDEVEDRHGVHNTICDGPTQALGLDGTGE